MLHSSPTFTPSMAGGEHAGCWCHGQPRQAAHHHHHDHRTPVPSPSLAFSDVDEVCRALWAELLSMDSQAQQHSPSTAASSEDQLSIQEVQDVLRQCVADSEADGDRAASASRPQGADAAANTSVSCSCCPRPARSGHTTPTSGIIHVCNLIDFVYAWKPVSVALDRTQLGAFVLGANSCAVRVLRGQTFGLKLRIDVYLAST